MNEKSAGWYYVGGGKLRYRDDHGWTEFFMDTDDPRTLEWPPPGPQAMLHQLQEEEAARAASRRQAQESRLSGIFGRSRRSR